ncbi:MAG: CPBP family intramembrane glutamic endopeptidase [Sulfuricaulis sp.]
MRHPKVFPWINGVVLAGGAVFSYPGRDYVLIGLMLFLPLVDDRWVLPRTSWNTRHLIAWICLALTGAGLLLWQPQYLGFALSTLLLAALPEEWFFRAYFMARLGGGWRANLIASLLFSLLHGLNRDWTTALMVFPASLLYGWLYQRTRDLPLLVLVHALSNLVFILYLGRYVAELATILR